MLLWECLIEASVVRNCCGIQPPISLLGAGMPAWLMGKVRSPYQHYLGRLVLCVGAGVSLPSLLGPQEPSPHSQGWKPTMLHAVSKAQGWRGSHHCFDLQGREVQPLTGSSKGIGQRGWGLGVEAVCCHCLPWRKAPAALAQRINPTHGQGSSAAPKGLVLEEP